MTRVTALAPRVPAPGVPCALLLLALACAPAAAAPLRLENVTGHLAMGYARLFATEAPAGSFSLAGGLDYTLAPDWKAGLSLGLSLLGSRTVERGSLLANVDYSLFEAVAFAHWQPGALGPLGRLSFGPGLFTARAELSTAGGGASFSDLARDETVPGFGFDATLMRRKPSPVRVGLELGARVVFLERETWTLAGARLAFHY